MPAIADVFVLAYRPGMSLRHRANSGHYEREREFLRAVSEHYGRIMIVTFGDERDEPLARACGPTVELLRCTDVSGGISVGAALVAERLKGATSAVVRTNQLRGGETALAVATALRTGGVRTGLVAHGGYLWSRFVAARHGFGSDEAAEAARLESELCRAADVTTGTTAEMTRDLQWRDALCDERCMVVPNFVLEDSPQHAADERSRTEILYVGQLIPRKRVDVLLQALPLVGLDGLTARIVGDGPIRDELEALAVSLGVRATFERHVPNREVLERMSRCAVFTQLSELEGHPRSVLEAMATGAPTLVADSPGLREAVTNGVNGLVVQPTPDAVASAMHGLLVDEAWRDQLGGIAAQRTRHSLSLRQVLTLELESHRRALTRAGCPQRPRRNTTNPAGGRAA